METDNLTTDFRDPRELRPHPDNPRGEIDSDSEEIVSLAADIEKRGILQPLVVSSTGVVHIGHRRRIAAIAAGLTLVPVIVRDLQNGEFVEEVFLAENMQRQDLSPLEEARAIVAVKRRMEKMAKKPVPTTDVARRLQLPKATITSRLAILRLPETVQAYFHTLDVPINSAMQLSRLEEWPEEVEKVADLLAKRQIAGKDLDGIITKRIRKLDREKADAATLVRSEKLAKIARSHPENHHRPVLTRAIAVENLTGKLRESVSMFNVKVVFDSVCNSCGLGDSPQVCLSCPVPKFVNGLVGRATGGGISDDEDLD